MGIEPDFQNPWAPGGQMHQQTPWGQEAIQHGWGHGNDFFTPKTQADIRKEALLQLAVLAVVVAAPALAGALSGGGTAGAAAASSGGGAAAGGVALESAAVSPLLASGGTAAAAGGTAAVGAGSAWLAGGAAMAALQPFLQAGGAEAAQAAARQGAGALNAHLHQEAPVLNDFVFNPGNALQPPPQFSADPPQAKAHPLFPFLNQVVEIIERDPSLRELLMQKLKAKHVSSSGVEYMAQTIGESLVDSLLRNPWEPENYVFNHSDSSNDDQTRCPEAYDPRPKYKGNLALIMRTEATTQTKEGFEIPGNDNWDAIVVDDIMEGLKEIKAYVRHLPDQKLTNLVIYSHGGPSSLLVLSDEKNWGINANDLYRYANGELQAKIGRLKDYPTEQNLKTLAYVEAKQQGIEALVEIPDYMGRDGNLCFAACNVANADGKNHYFLEHYHELLLFRQQSIGAAQVPPQGLGFNIWASKGYVRLAIGKDLIEQGEDSFFKKPMSLKTCWALAELTKGENLFLTSGSAVKDGWIQISPDGTRILHFDHSPGLSSSIDKAFRLYSHEK